MRLFSHALELGDRLVVGIVRDEEANTGDDFSETLLRNLPFVSEVIIGADASSIIRKANPHFIVKGFEHREGSAPESEAIDEVGAKIVYTSGNPFLTESDLLEGMGQLLKPEIQMPKDYLSRNGINPKTVSRLMLESKKKKVLIFGDLIVDEYVACHAVGMSQEDPMVVNAPISSHLYVGGAGIVAAHCRALGAETMLISTTGEDSTAEWVEKKLTEYGINSYLLRDTTRPTTLKQRYKSDKQTLFRLSHFKQHPIEKEMKEALCKRLEQELQSVDLLILSDFSYGVLDAELAKFAIEKAKDLNVQIAADSQSSSQVGDLGKFFGVDHIFATEREARLQLRNDLDGLAVIAGKLRKELSAQNIFLKLGADGVLLEGVNSSSSQILNTERIPALNRNPVDVSGAGDSMLAACSLCLISGGTFAESAFVGSVVAAIQVGRQGNTPVTIEEVLQLLETTTS
jgi:rfaE bifunctional protein kinase chain/domain